MRILFLNAGSATVKTSLVVDGVSGARRTLDRVAGDLGDDAIGHLISEATDGAPVDAVAHRFVHGGERFVGPTRIDDSVEHELEALAALAPLHQPPALDLLRAARRALSVTPHVACFDTAFHATLPEEQVRYPVPDRWRRDLGVRRYGFHGLSVAWAVSRAAELLDRSSDELRVVVAHLGSGCSVTAVRAGRSTWTSMGFTPLEGLMMGTRSGSIDPGALLHVLRADGATLDGVADELEHASGLRGVSGRADLREVEAAADAGDARATLAIRMFVARAAAAVASAATTLDRIDALVFTGGIGEHAVRVRAAIVARLVVLGVPPVPTASTDEDAVLASRSGGPSVLRIEAREDLSATRAAEALLTAAH